MFMMKNICGMIKQNESEFANTDLEIEPKPSKGNKVSPFVFYCFDHDFNRSQLWNHMSDFNGFFSKMWRITTSRKLKI